MEVTLLDMLKSGVHFGHQTKRWHPKMKSFIYTTRSGVHIINLEKTQERLALAVEYVRTLAAEGKTIVFIGTKRQAKDILKKSAEACSMPYLTERWIGGFLTNFGVVSRLMSELRKLKADKKSGALLKYKKHEQMQFDEDIERLEFLVGGVEHLTELPHALFVVDIKKERTAINEAKKMGIPVIALTDTNTNPELVDYPIPANDDATKSIELICTVISDAIAEGKKNPKVAETVEKGKPKKTEAPKAKEKSIHEKE